MIQTIKKGGINKGGIPWGLVAALGLLCVVVLSACAIPGLVGANTTPSPGLDPQQAALKFAQCMRTNGVPNFPDPTFSSGGGVTQKLGGSGIDPSDPTFQKALQACSKYEQGNPSTNPSPDPAAQALALKYSQCMRANGVPNFPDPDISGGISIVIDPRDPTFQKAQQTCQPLLDAVGRSRGGSK